MINLISICDFFWLLWFLPFLLGMLFTWLYWRNKYANMVADYDGKINRLNGRVKSLEGDLADCSAKRSELEGDLAITKGRMRELDSEMKALKISSAKEKSEKVSRIASLSNTVSASNVSGISSDSNIPDVASSPTGPVATNLTPNTKGSNTEKTSKKSMYSGLKSDNLQIVEGIGPKMESILKENGVNSHSDLAKQTPDSLLAILGKYGDKYKIIDPSTWAQQAGYAASEDYDGMIVLQKKLDGGKDNASGPSNSKLEKYLIRTGALKAFKLDDLKAIEGIGPATEKLLHENGIKTWRNLANTEASAVKAILTAAGSRFALGDPTTWPKQAEMAADGKFDELREYQDFLDGGRG